VPSSALVVAIRTSRAVPGDRHIDAKAILRRQLTNLGENALPDSGRADKSVRKSHSGKSQIDDVNRSYERVTVITRENCGLGWMTKVKMQRRTPKA
jgi:hypothetical protein